MKKIKLGIYFIVISVLFENCKGQSVNINSCDRSYENALVMIGKYGETSNKSILKTAMKSIDSSLICKETKRKSVFLKISVFLMLEEYANGFDFVDSLKVDDFNRPYKKKMYSDIFKAERLNLSGDSNGCKKIYSLISNDIIAFIDESNLRDFDRESFNSLLLIELKHLSVPEIVLQLDKFKLKYPGESDFFDSLKDMVSQESNIVE